MLQLTPHSRIFLATAPVDFRKGIDGLAAFCRQVLGDNPLEGAIYVFRNRASTALKLLLYDGQGYWLCMKRLSQGHFTWWPTTTDSRVPWPRGRSSSYCGMATPSGPIWRPIGNAWAKAGRDAGIVKLLGLMPLLDSRECILGSTLTDPTLRQPALSP
jgi:transposase